MALTSAIASAHQPRYVHLAPAGQRHRYRCPAHLELGRRLHGDLMWKSGRTFVPAKDSVVKAPVLGWSVKKTGVAVERKKPTARRQVAQLSASPTRSRCASPRRGRVRRVMPWCWPPYRHGGGCRSSCFTNRTPAPRVGPMQRPDCRCAGRHGRDSRVYAGKVGRRASPRPRSRRVQRTRRRGTRNGLRRWGAGAVRWCACRRG